MNFDNFDSVFWNTMIETFSRAPDSQISERVTNLLKQAIKTEMSPEQMFNIIEWLARDSCCETSSFVKNSAEMMIRCSN